MRHATVIVVAIGVFCGVAYSQEPARTRRGLDQMDLLTIPRSADRPSVNVDLETFELLEPLINHSRGLETFFRENVLAKPAVPSDDVHEAFGRKTVAVYRSIFLIKEIKKTLSPELRAILDQSSETAKFLGKVAAIVRFDAPITLEKEMSDLYREYGMTTSDDYRADRLRLIGVMVRKLNENFSKIRVVR